MKSRIPAIILTVVLGATLAGCTGTGGSDGNGGPADARITGTPSATASATSSAPKMSATVPSPSITYGTELNDAALRQNGKTSFTFANPKDGATIGVLIHGNADAQLSLMVTAGNEKIVARTYPERPDQYNAFVPRAVGAGTKVTVTFQVTGTQNKSTFGGVVAFEGSNGQ